MSASVHQRLLNISRETTRPFDEMLQYYAMERFLYRLSQSPHAHSFVLKGALLFRIWNTPDTRATRDIDFLAYVENSPDNLADIVRLICATDVLNDGLIFDAESVKAQRIKEDADYGGVRIRFSGRLGNARIHMQVDVGFGDTIHPAVVQEQYPALLDLPAPSLRTYPPESVVAEKAEAMVHLGTLNSRMKDFYDIWRLSRQHSFAEHTLCEAVMKTFATRDTEIIHFDDLVTELMENDNPQRQWIAFLNKTAVDGPESFSDVLNSISAFLSPVFAAVKSGLALKRNWVAPGPWRN